MPKPGSFHMRTAQKSKKSTDWFRIQNAHVDEEGSDSEKTLVYIYDVIGDSWWDDSTPASDFIKQISAIHTPKIELHLNSPGGDIFDGVAIYNALKSHPAEVTVVIDALAASAASFIAQAGDKIVMTKAATMMIHDGSAMAWGPASVMRDTADLLDKLSNTVAEIYSDRAGQTIEFWRDLMIEETWYNSHEAVEAGLADEIGEDTKDEDDTKAQNAWDMSIFNYAGRGSAPNPFEVRSRIANRLKENTVGRPTNEGGEEKKETGSPETDPAAETTEGTAGETDEAREEDSSTNPGAVPDPPTGDSDPEKSAEDSGDPSNSFKPQNVNGTVTFLVNGVQTSDMAAIQSHINTLENFASESVKAGKKQFVENLAADGKIMASQIDDLIEYANELTDAQYDRWQNTWKGAAANPMFERQTGGVSDAGGPQSQAKAAEADQKEVWRDIVQHHKRSGMRDEQIKATDSYKNLIAADPEFKL